MSITEREREKRGKLKQAKSAALNEITKSGLSLDEMINISHFSEMQATKSISGTQDFYISGYGGINSIWFSWKGVKIEPLRVTDSFLRNLEARLTLCYSGEKRFSGEIDWRVLRKYIEGNSKVVNSIKGIIEVAINMRDAILEEDVETVGVLIAKDWEKGNI